jgi:hypothetical protein
MILRTLRKPGRLAFQNDFIGQTLGLSNRDTQASNHNIVREEVRPGIQVEEQTYKPEQ